MHSEMESIFQQDCALEFSPTTLRRKSFWRKEEKEKRVEGVVARIISIWELELLKGIVSLLTWLKF